MKNSKLLFALLLAVPQLCMSQPIFYGVTSKGGTFGLGTLYSIAPDGTTFEPAYDFFTDVPGEIPGEAMVRAGNGKLYGVTQRGGAFDAGVLFEYDPVTDVYTVKSNFNPLKGAYPICRPAYYDGKIFGIAYKKDVSARTAVLFQYDLAAKSFAVIIEFDAYPNHSLESNGLLVYEDKLYGMFSDGGDFNKGFMFEADPITHNYKVLHHFNAGQGENPLGLLTPFNGKLYGMAFGGGSYDGVIFEYDLIAESYAVKLNFDGNNGSNPQGTLLEYNGKLYGTTLGGGTGGYGILFEYDPGANSLQKKWDFSENWGIVPKGKLVVWNEKLYGLTEGGGTYSGGVLFSYEPLSGVYSKEKEFDKGSPNGSLTEVNGKLYGTSNGTQIPVFPYYLGRSALFEFAPSTQSFEVKRVFNRAENGAVMGTGVTLVNQKLYGVTTEGGDADLGVLFEYDPATKNYQKKYSFSEWDGSNPMGKLTVYQHKLYGVTSFGGAENLGVLYEYDPIANTYAVKKEFNVLEGSLPSGSLFEYNGILYGLTSEGGTFSKGVFYSFNPETGAYTVLKHFQADAQGYVPAGSLVEMEGKLYGRTSGGGAYNGGVLFEYDPVSHLYTKLQDMGCCNREYGHLTPLNGKLYGIVYAFAPFWSPGELFEFDPAADTIAYKGIFGQIETGYFPESNLSVYGNKLYGTTSMGGSFDSGVLFEYNPETEAVAALFNFNGESGIRPYGDLTLVDLLNPTQEETVKVEDISVSPNPAGKRLFVLNQSDSEGYFVLIQPGGQVLAEIKLGKYEKNIIDLGMAPSGLAFWKWTRAKKGGTQTGRVIIAQ